MLHLVSSLVPLRPNCTPFPYTTLFRSPRQLVMAANQLVILLPPRPDSRVVREVVGGQRQGRYRRGRQADELLPCRGGRKRTRLNSSHVRISYAVLGLKKIRQTCQSIVF